MQRPATTRTLAIGKLRTAMAAVLLSLPVVAVSPAGATGPAAGAPALRGAHVDHVPPRVAPPGTTARSVDEVLRGWPSLNVQQRGAVVEQLIVAGQLDLAERLIADFGSGTALHRSTARFLTAMLRNAQGRVDEAIAIYREMLAENPEFTRVRLLLAVALYQKRDDASARHHFELVMGAAGNAELSTQINRFIDSIDQRKRLTFSAYSSIVPSTNFNQGTDTRIVNLNGLEFLVDANTQRQSGVGFASGFNAAYRQPLLGRLDLVVGGGVQSRLFRNSAFSDWSVAGEAGPRYRFDWADIGLYGTASRRWFGGEHWYGGQSFSMSYGARLHTRLRLDNSNVVDTSLSCAEKRYDFAVWQDGWNCAVSLSADHFLDSRTFLRLLGGVEHEHAAREWLDYDAASIGFGAYREIERGLSLYGQVLYANRLYGAMFPAAGVARVDDRIDATVQVTKRDWYVKGLAPMLQYTYTRNFSSVALYDYDAHNLNLTLTQSF